MNVNQSGCIKHVSAGENTIFKLRGRLHMDHNWQAGLLMQFTVDNGIKFNISKSQSIDFYPNFGQDKWRLITFEGDNFQKAYMYKWNFTQWLNYAYSQSFTMLCMNLTGILINRCIRTCLFFPLQVTLRKLTKSSKNYLTRNCFSAIGWYALNYEDCNICRCKRRVWYNMLSAFQIWVAIEYAFFK